MSFAAEPEAVLARLGSIFARPNVIRATPRPCRSTPNEGPGLSSIGCATQVESTCCAEDVRGRICLILLMMYSGAKMSIECCFCVVVLCRDKRHRVPAPDQPISSRSKTPDFASPSLHTNPPSVFFRTGAATLTSSVTKKGVSEDFYRC